MQNLSSICGFLFLAGSALLPSSVYADNCKTGDGQYSSDGSSTDAGSKDDSADGSETDADSKVDSADGLSDGDVGNAKP